jgi:sugar-specific transcriptional regulator TrmB
MTKYKSYMDKRITQVLEQIGLSGDQTKVYLAALELGEATMQELATKSGVPRTSIYNFMKEMVRKRLIATGTRKRRTVYSAIHPNILIEMEKGRLSELQQLLPEILTIYNKSKTKPRVTFHEGVAGIKEVLFDMLKEQQAVVAWSDYDAMAASFGEYYFDVFPAERAKKGILCRNIVPDTPKAREFSKKDNRYLRESKFIKSSNNLKTEINIYGNKVALNSHDPQHAFALLIEDTNLATTLRAIWQQQWQSLD